LILLEIVRKHALSCPCTSDHERSTYTGVKLYEP